MDKEIEAILKLISTEKRLGIVLGGVGMLQIIVGIYTTSRYFAVVNEFYRDAYDKAFGLSITNSLLLIFGLLLIGLGFLMYTGKLKMQHVSPQYPQQTNPSQSVICPPQQHYPLIQQYPPQNPSPPPPL